MFLLLIALALLRNQPQSVFFPLDRSKDKDIIPQNFSLFLRYFQSKLALENTFIESIPEKSRLAQSPLETQWIYYLTTRLIGIWR